MGSQIQGQTAQTATVLYLLRQLRDRTRKSVNRKDCLYAVNEL